MPQGSSFFGHILGACALLCVALTHDGCAAVGDRPRAEAEASVLVAYPIVFNNPPSVIVVPVTVQGREYPFIIDTGASVTVYDTTFRPMLGKPVEMQVAGMGAGKTRLAMYRAPEASLGELSLPADGLVAAADLATVRDAVRQVSGQEVYGIIGMDFLKDYVLRIDFASKQLEVLKSEPSCGGDWGERFEIEYQREGVPAITATVSDGIEARFLVDTGDAGTGDLESQLFDRLCANGAIAITGTVQCATGSGYRQTPEGRLDRLALGPFRHDGLRLFKSHWNGLGLGYLSHYTVTFDFPQGAIYLKPSAAPQAERLARRDVTASR